MSKPSTRRAALALAVPLTIGLLAACGSHPATKPVSPAADIGCHAVETNLPTQSAALQAATDDASRTSAIQALIDELKADEQKTSVPTARTAMESFRHDLEQLQTGLQTGRVDPSLTGKLTADGAAVDAACR